MSFAPDPPISDAEWTNAIARLEDRFSYADLVPDHPVRPTHVDPLGYGRWGAGAYFAARQRGEDHETATQGMLAQIDAVLHPAPPPLRPNPPTRERACSIRRHFQGLLVDSRQYSPPYGGPLPWFVATLGSFEAELDHMIDQFLAAGDTHCQLDFAPDGPGYNAPGQPYGDNQVVPNRNFEHDLPGYVKIIDRIIARGLIPIYALNGEGSPTWIRANLERLVAALKGGYDRTQYGPFYVVYDGVWPATWSVADMKTMLPWMRSAIGPNAYLGMMFATANGRPYFYVEDEQDYHKPWMQALDFVMMSTGPDQIECPALVNGMQYLLGPQLTPHGVCTPAWHGPWLMQPGTPRGPYYAGFDEWDEYRWVRKQIDQAKIDRDRARLDALGITNHG